MSGTVTKTRVVLTALAMWLFPWFVALGQTTGGCKPGVLCNAAGFTSSVRGTASRPAFRFAGDPDTGVFQTGSNWLVSVDGTFRLEVTPSYIYTPTVWLSGAADNADGFRCNIEGCRVSFNPSGTIYLESNGSGTLSTNSPFASTGEMSAATPDDGWRDADGTVSTTGWNDRSSQPNFGTNRRWSALTYTGESATPVYIGGMGTATVTGTAGTDFTVATRFQVSYTSGAVSGNTAGLFGAAANWRFGWSPKMSTRVTTGAAITLARYWIGLTNGDLSAADTLTGQPHAAFRFSTAIPDTNWMCCHSAGTGTETCTSSGVVVTASTSYDLRIEHATGRTDYYINGVGVCSETINLPGAATNARYQLAVTTLTAAARAFSHTVVAVEDAN